MAKRQTKELQVDVLQVERGHLTFMLLGTSPILLNRLSEKTRRELLMPKGRKTASEKASSLKHNPIREFRDSAHWLDANQDTLLAIPATAFKGAMMTAALDMPGLTKAAIGRHVYVVGEYVGIYGVPKLDMRCVRSADMNKTPDVRTRVIVPEWCAKVDVHFVKPMMRDKQVAQLMAAAGIISGVGDFRPEKGKGSHGQFSLVNANDKAFSNIIKAGSRAEQVVAMDDAEPYNDESRELLSWFIDESDNRGWEITAGGDLVKKEA